MRSSHSDKDSLKALQSKLRLLRKRGAVLKDMRPEVISHLDAAVDILQRNKKSKAISLQRRGMS